MLIRLATTCDKVSILLMLKDARQLLLILFDCGGETGLLAAEFDRLSVGDGALL